MSNTVRKDAANNATAPLVVQVEGQFAGLAVKEGGRFRFLSVHPGFDLLDGSLFTRPEEIRIAARKLARAAKPQ
jgi:hypothetical protein